jgi:hypothetical protein
MRQILKSMTDLKRVASLAKNMAFIARTTADVCTVNESK